MPTVKIHPNAPPRLVKRYRKAGSFHKLADELEINVSYVHELITKGIEPTDRTAAGREIRKRLYLTKYKRKGSTPRKPRQPRPEHMRWWKRQGPDGRDNLIRQLHDINKDAMP